jgi:hypothetical protein
MIRLLAKPGISFYFSKFRFLSAKDFLIFKTCLAITCQRILNYHLKGFSDERSNISF